MTLFHGYAADLAALYALTDAAALLLPQNGWLDGKTQPVYDGKLQHNPAAVGVGQQSELGYICTNGANPNYSAGDLAGGIHFKDGARYQNAPSDFLLLGNEGGYGDQIWRYVKNETGSTIARGKLLKPSAIGTSMYSVALLDGTGGSPDDLSECVGCAQWNIPDDTGTFVLVRGIGYASVDAAIAAGVTIIADTSTAGDVQISASINDKTAGLVVVGTAGAGFAKVFFQLPWT